MSDIDSKHSSSGHPGSEELELARQDGYPAWTGKRKWYRSTFTNITILGIVSFLGKCLSYYQSDQKL